MFYANANKAATPLVSAEVRENPAIYPPADVRAKLFTLKVQDPKIDRVRTRAWTKVKSGKYVARWRSLRPVGRAGAPHPPAIRTIMVRLHTFNAGEQP